MVIVCYGHREPLLLLTSDDKRVRTLERKPGVSTLPKLLVDCLRSSSLPIR